MQLFQRGAGISELGFHLLSLRTFFQGHTRVPTFLLFSDSSFPKKFHAVHPCLLVRHRIHVIQPGGPKFIEVDHLEGFFSTFFLTQSSSCIGLHSPPVRIGPLYLESSSGLNPSSVGRNGASSFDRIPIRSVNGKSSKEIFNGWLLET